MIRPVHFGYNEQTAGSNAFQHIDHSYSAEEIRARAQAEFDAFVDKLRGAGIDVAVFDDTSEPHTPDAVFPNNWITTHRDGTIVLYPMQAPNRRLERRADVVRHVGQYYLAPRVLDLSAYEAEGRYLEGTGSMIMDRVHQRVYACVSPRTDAALFQWFCHEMACDGYLFEAVDALGQQIYHTNVMMALGTHLAVICLDAIHDLQARVRVVHSLEETGHEIVPITYSQMLSFAGNMLEVCNDRGEPFMVMSRRAFDALRPDQIATIERYAAILVGELDVIETYGGGSVRCMMAEIFR